MPPKPKRLPSPAQFHLKHSLQLLEDYLYQYLPLLTSLGAVSRINLFTWFNSKWALSADASGGLPYMLLEALRRQRQHQLTHKKTLKPFNFSVFGAEEDKNISKALEQLQLINKQSHTATLKASSLSWQDILKQLQVLLQQQPHSERNLLILDPMELSLPSLLELFQILPKKLDVLLLIPKATVLLAGGVATMGTVPEAVQQLSGWLPLLLLPEDPEAEADAISLHLLQQLKGSLAESSKRFIMQYPAPDGSTGSSPLLLFGCTADSLMMEKMLQARRQLEKRQEQQLQTGNQLGLFGTSAEKPNANAFTPLVKALLSSQSEWNNQELYRALLLQELLPQEGLQALEELIGGGQLEMLDEKKKKLKDISQLSINHTAFKLPAPSRYFRWKG